MVGTITTEEDITIGITETLGRMKPSKGMATRGLGFARNVRRVIRAIHVKANQLNVMLVAKLGIRLIIVPKGKKETNQGRMDTTRAITTMEEDLGTITSTTTARIILKQEIVQQMTSTMPTTIRTTMETMEMEDTLSMEDSTL